MHCSIPSGGTRTRSMTSVHSTVGNPVSTGNEGWETFLGVYNQWCSDRNGVPLLNQTWGLTPAIVQKAFGDRLTTMKQARKEYDPDGRLLNDYFRTLMS